MIENYIKSTRNEKNMSQKELAALSGISRQALHAIETSLSVPSLETALKIAKHLDVSVDKLFQIKSDTKDAKSPPSFGGLIFNK